MYVHIWNLQDDMVSATINMYDLDIHIFCVLFWKHSLTSTYLFSLSCCKWHWLRGSHVSCSHNVWSAHACQYIQRVRHQPAPHCGSCNTLSAAHVLTIAFHDAQLLALLQFGFVKLTNRLLAHQQPCSKTWKHSNTNLKHQVFKT